MSGEPEKACLACGTCCFSRLNEYARVHGADHARLAERAEELTIFIGNRCYMRMHQGHCAALVVDAMSGVFFCSVYDSRPNVCRELVRGSPACAGELVNKGDRPAQLVLLLSKRPPLT